MSTTIVVAPTTTSPLPPAFTTDSGDDGGDGGGGGGIAQRGANYFFGFLITFVVLLLIFVGCGIGSRRRYLARRHEVFFGATLDSPWGAGGGGGPGDLEQMKEPVFFEYSVGEPRVEDKWMYISPLSMTLLRQPKDMPPSSDSQNSDMENANHPTEERPHHRGLSTLMIPFHERKRPPAPMPEKMEFGGPEALDIAVMIAMPSPQHSHSRRAPRYSKSSTYDPTVPESIQLPELQIGVATIPWHTEIGSVS